VAYTAYISAYLEGMNFTPQVNEVRSSGRRERWPWKEVTKRGYKLTLWQWQWW